MKKHIGLLCLWMCLISVVNLYGMNDKEVQCQSLEFDIAHSKKKLKDLSTGFENAQRFREDLKKEKQALKDELKDLKSPQKQRREIKEKIKYYEAGIKELNALLQKSDDDLMNDLYVEQEINNHNERLSQIEAELRLPDEELIKKAEDNEYMFLGQLKGQYKGLRCAKDKKDSK